MIPLRDDNPTLLTPIITIAIIIVNVVVWIYLEGGGVSESVLTSSVCSFGTIPAELTGRLEDYYRGAPIICEPGGLTWSTVFTSMFLHGSWLHLIGNMWFLWLFGDNVEDSMGHLRFLAFYLIGGVAGAAGHVFMNPDSLIPTVGASGAISALMGGYLVLYPRARIHTLFILFVFIKIIPIPAWFVLGQYLVVQLLTSSAAMGATGGVAVWAHIGGFGAGVVLVKLFENRMLVAARKQHIKLSPYEINHRGWW
ncbi:MAG: rhomboid family intramembrane serine protease [Gemmatimonadota bacterium]